MLFLIKKKQLNIVMHKLKVKNKLLMKTIIIYIYNIDFKGALDQLNSDIHLLCLCGNHDVGNAPSQ
jgi:hypothetical protein